MSRGSQPWLAKHASGGWLTPHACAPRPQAGSAIIYACVKRILVNDYCQYIYGLVIFCILCNFIIIINDNEEQA